MAAAAAEAPDSRDYYGLLNVRREVRPAGRAGRGGRGGAARAAAPRRPARPAAPRGEAAAGPPGASREAPVGVEGADGSAVGAVWLRRGPAAAPEPQGPGSVPGVRGSCAEVALLNRGHSSCLKK